MLRAKVSTFVDLFVQSEELKGSLDSITALNAALRDSEVRARAVLQNVADGIVTAGEGGLIESFNQSARRLFGYREDEVIGQPMELIIAPSHQDDFADPARARWSLLTAADIPAEPTETVGCRKDGSCFPMEMDMSQMQIGERTFTIGCIRDISGRKAYTEALEHRTLHDDLTGLPNRALFGDRMDRALADAERADEPRGVLLVDVDGFRMINETLGRDSGDVVLKTVAERLQTAVRNSDTIARLGGDEFGVLLSSGADATSAVPIARLLVRVLEAPFMLDAQPVEIGGSIGIAAFPAHGSDAATLLRQADVAMYVAKREKLGTVVYAAEQDHHSADRLALGGELRMAIENDELLLQYQPKVDMSGALAGVEALVRWRHPQRGIIAPRQFIGRPSTSVSSSR